MDVEMRSSPSSTEEQMDIVSMMMHMEKLPDDFYNPNSSTSSTTLHEPHFSNNTLPTHVITSYPNLQATSPTYNNLNPNSKIPFMGTPQPLPFLSNQTPYLEKRNKSTGAIREMIFGVAAMQPIHIDPEAIKPPKRRNVKISKDPQSVAARHRRERISERIRILQRLVPGGTRMDTASMLDEAVHYVKFLKKQVQYLEEQAAGANNIKGPIMGSSGLGLLSSASGVTINPNVGYFSLGKNCQPNLSMQVGSMQMLR